MNTKDKWLIGGGMAIAFASIFGSSLIAPTIAQKTATAPETTEVQPLAVQVVGVQDGKLIPVKNAYCIATATEKSSMTGQNISPQIRWGKGPLETKSYAVVMVDKDVPTDFTNAGKEGKTIPAEMPRRDFFHWAVVNIPASTFSLEEGVGKNSKSEYIGLQAINDYAAFMKDKPAETFKGYDGPCPPWNDSIAHHYHFHVFALSKEMTIADFPNVKNGAIDARDVPVAIAPYILAKGRVVGTYTLNAALNAPASDSAPAQSPAPAAP